MTRDQIKAEREAFDEWWLTHPVGSTSWKIWQAALASRKPLSEAELEAIVAATENGSAIYDFARAIEQAHGIGEKP